MYYSNDEEMKATRIKAHRFIHSQQVKAGVRTDEFDVSSVDNSDIRPGEVFYSGVVYKSSEAPRIAQWARMLGATDASHMKCSTRLGTSGTYFELTLCDQNGMMIGLVCAHFMGNEDELNWSRVFEMARSIEHFDVPGRTVVADMEKGIRAAFYKCFTHAKLFFDKIHVEKNLSAALGKNEQKQVELYKKAVIAPSKMEVDELKSQYGSKMTLYFQNYLDSEVYRAYSRIEEYSTHTSQMGESAQMKAVATNVRCSERFTMLRTIVQDQAKTIHNMQSEANKCSSHVPPRVESFIGHLIMKAAQYSGKVNAEPGTNQFVYNVTSLRDPYSSHRVELSREPHVPPMCCKYSRMGNGMPCYHGVAVILQKYGSGYLHKCIAERYLTSTWKAAHEGASYAVPAQYEVEEVEMAAKRAILSGHYIRCPKARAPPRGRPAKNAGKRFQNFLERGTGSKQKRTYKCSFCRKEDHDIGRCPERQLFLSEAEPTGDASEAEPTGGASEAEPTGGASEAEPTGGASEAEPTGGASEAEPTGGASEAEPTGGAIEADPTGGL